MTEKYLAFEENDINLMLNLSQRIDKLDNKKIITKWTFVTDTAILALLGQNTILDNDNNDDDTSSYIEAMAKIYWEIVKASPLSQEAIEDIFISLKLSNPLAKLSAESFFKQNHRLLILKKDSRFAANHYDDLNWRLDIEVVRRNSTMIMKPEYTLGLTLRDSKTQNDTKSHYELKSNYANMKKMLDSLVDANKELSRNHSQRFVRYIA